MLNRDLMIRAIEKAYGMYALPKEKPLKKGHITDYDKSVRWNEQVVEESQKKYKEEYTRLRREKERAIQDTKDMYVYPYIRENLCDSYTDDGIRFLFSTAYENAHSGGANEIINELDSLIDFLNDMRSFAITKQ